MKRVVALLLALCLCLVLCACGGSETPQPQNAAKEQETATQQETVKEEELYEKSGTTEDGTTFTTWRRGGPEGTPVKLIYDAPDGTHYEEYYSYEGVLEYCITTGTDGSSYEIFFYLSGNMEKSILDYVRGRLENRDDIDTRRIFITHSQVPQEIVDKVAALIKELQPFDEVIVSLAGCTISSHCGPNCLGILFFKKA